MIEVDDGYCQAGPGAHGQGLGPVEFFREGCPVWQAGQGIGSRFAHRLAGTLQLGGDCRGQDFGVHRLFEIRFRTQGETLGFRSLAPLGRNHKHGNPRHIGALLQFHQEVAAVRVREYQIKQNKGDIFLPQNLFGLGGAFGGVYITVLGGQPGLEYAGLHRIIFNDQDARLPGFTLDSHGVQDRQELLQFRDQLSGFSIFNLRGGSGDFREAVRGT